MRALIAIVTLVFAACGVDSGTARAQCAEEWRFAAPGFVATRVPSDTGFGPGLSFVAAGTSLSAVWNAGGMTPPHGAGQALWTVTFLTSLTSFPNPVPLSSGGEAVFVASADGKVYGIDAVTHAVMWSRDLRRLACPSDQILATPSVQLRSYSNGAFQSAFAHDLVYVVTRYACGATSENKVYALDASDGAIEWEFDPSTTEALAMDFATEGCTIDYANNRIYFGTNQPAANPTLWAVSTLDGTRAWSRNVGSIRTQPQLLGGTVYVVNESNVLRAHQAGSGAPIWTLALALSGGHPKTPWVESRPPYRHSIFVTDGGGVLHAVVEDTTTTTAFSLWAFSAPLPAVVTTAPVLNTANGRVYVGRSDGVLEQLLASTGTVDAERALCTAAPIADLALDAAPGPDFDHLTAPQGQDVVRTCIPWTPASYEVICPPVVSVPEQTRSPLQLLRAAPNPFRSSTMIRVRSSIAGNLRLAIYDLCGRCVRTLLSGWRVAGEFSIGWNGDSDAGRRVASGVYICRFEAGAPAPSLIAAQKLALMK